MGEVQKDDAVAFELIDGHLMVRLALGRGLRPADEADDGLPSTYHRASPPLAPQAMRGNLRRAAYLAQVSESYAHAEETWWREMWERWPGLSAWRQALPSLLRVRVFPLAVAMAAPMDLPLAAASAEAG